MLAHATNLYMDLAYNKDPNEPGYYWASFIDDRSTFTYQPFGRRSRSGHPPPRWPVPAEIEPRRRSSHCAALRVWRPCVSIAFERDLQVIAAEAPLNPSTTAARHPGITLPEKAQRTLIVAALPIAPAKPPAATLIRAALPALTVRWVFAEVTCAVFLPTAVLMR